MMKIENFQHAKNQGFLSMRKNIIMLIILLVVLVVSVVQAVQLNELKSTVESKGTVTSSASSTTSSGEVSVPKNLGSLPSMVGGC